MNSKVAREGLVHSERDLQNVKERLFKDVAEGLIKNAGIAKKEANEDKKEEKSGEFKDKMTKKEANELGFFKSAKQCGWGIYQISDLDGGIGSIWFLEKDADGQEFLVKQVDSAGEVVRRMNQSEKQAV